MAVADATQTEIVRTALDYFEGWFDGDSERMERALHPGLAKRSFRQVDHESAELRTVTKEQMVTWTAAGEGKTVHAGDDRRIDVEVVDVFGSVASVVARSPVYREYIHLVQTDERWTIVGALWHWT